MAQGLTAKEVSAAKRRLREARDLIEDVQRTLRDTNSFEKTLR
jgi:hypothetical protein